MSVAAARALLRVGQFGGAERLALIVLQQADSAELWRIVGMARDRQGRREGALYALERCIALEPANVPARLDHGVLLLEDGRAERALAEFDFLAAMVSLPVVQINRARALFALFRDREALAAADQAVALDANDPLAWHNKALAHGTLGESAAAASAFERASALAPELVQHLNAKPLFGGRGGVPPDPEAIAAVRGLQRQWQCNWQDHEQAASRMLALARLPFSAPRSRFLRASAFDTLAFASTPAAQLEYMRQAARAARAAQPPGSVRPHSRAGGKARIGILSPDFRDHPSAWLTRDLLRGLDRARYEVFAYALNPDDRSAWRKALAGSVDRFTEAGALSDESVAARIAEDGVDLLIECGGYCDGVRPEILALRPAPLQASYLGSPCTLGASFIDYRISDAYCTPASLQPHFAEKLVLVPETHLVHDRPQVPAAPERATLGLPREGVVYCCMSNPAKIDPVAFGAWMRILKAVPGSVLWLYADDPLARANLKRNAQAEGIDAVRLLFASRLPRERFLGAISRADLFLDTFNFSAHTAAIDALWAGLPVLARPGQTMASRLAASLLMAARLPELVAATTDEYVERAVRLGLEPAALRAQRERVEAARTASPLFDTAARVAKIEAAIAAILERHRAGLAPDTLVID